MSLPELPENEAIHKFMKAYTEKQMHEYGALCRKQALDDAMRICDGEKWEHQTGAYSIRFIDTYNGACNDCMEAIGRLI